MHSQPGGGFASLHALVLVEGHHAVEEAARGAVEEAQAVDCVAQEVARPRCQRRPQVPHLQRVPFVLWTEQVAPGGLDHHVGHPSRGT